MPPLPEPQGINVRASPCPPRPPRALDLSRYPNVYDAAFSWDRSQEARTYLRVAASRMGKPPRSAAELACGTGPLARLWASWGLEVYGVDRSAPAVTQARELGRGTVPPGHWLLGDLRSFRLPRRVEMAVVPMDSLGYLVEEVDILAFFRAVRRCLAPGGVLAIDLTLHPEGAPPLPLRNAWKVSLRPRGISKSAGAGMGDPGVHLLAGGRWGGSPSTCLVDRIRTSTRRAHTQPSPRGCSGISRTRRAGSEKCGSIPTRPTELAGRGYLGSPR